MIKLYSHLRAIATADGAVILDTSRSKISTLNATGSYVWQALERGEPIESIAEGLASETGESLDVLKDDVRSFIVSLREQHLLAG